MTITASNLESHGSVDPLGDDESINEEVLSRSPFRLAAARFRKDKLSMVAFIITCLFIVIAVVSPILVAIGVLDPNTFHQTLLDIPNGGFYPSGNSYGASLHHPLGIEPGTGRDLLSRIFLGITISLAIALSGAFVTVAIGTIAGIVAGFTGGIVDGIIGRIIDLVLAFPATLMLLALSQVVVERMSLGIHIFFIHLYVPSGPNGALVNGAYVSLVLAAFGWPPVARLIRGQVLTIREREFVDAAILMGASRRRIYFKEILPNLWAPLLVYFTLLMPAFVSAEAALAFLGIGIRNPTPTLGNVLNSALLYQETDPLFFYVPAVMIAAIVISFNLLGDGVRDALDPKSAR